MKIDDCRTCTSRDIELNAKSNQLSDRRTGQQLNAPRYYRA